MNDTSFPTIYYRAHRDILVFASPFFEAALSGDWSETRPESYVSGRRQSISSVITISQPPVVPGDTCAKDNPTEMTFTPVDPDASPDEVDIDELSSDFEELNERSDGEKESPDDVKNVEEKEKEQSTLR